MRIKTCRICKSTLINISTLGKFPAVNYYLSKKDLKKKEKKYTLSLYLCENCGLGQLNEIVSADKLFITYHYISSTSKPLITHLQSLGKICEKRFKLKSKSKVLDIGCNDGALLHYFKEKGYIVLGIDPAGNAVKDAKSKGIQVVKGFFNNNFSISIGKKYGKFNVIFATNTLAQIINLHDFVNGVKNILDYNGVFIIEVGYILDMKNKMTFDSIYHEHYSYFSLRSLVTLFSEHDLDIFDAQRIANHGGSLRVFIKFKNNQKYKTTKRFERILDNENKIKLNKAKTYLEFTNRIKDFKTEFRNLLIGLNKQKKVIVGLGAPAKSVVLLNFTGINNEIISYITDSTSHKQYKYMPGVHIPIMPEDKILENNNIDYFLLLAWTYKKEMLNKIKKLHMKNTKIIIPFPKLKIISG